MNGFIFCNETRTCFVFGILQTSHITNNQKRKKKQKKTYLERNQRPTFVELLVRERVAANVYGPKLVECIEQAELFLVPPLALDPGTGLGGLQNQSKN